MATTYINETWDGVTAPSLPAGWTITGGSGYSGVTSTSNKYSGTNALRFSGVSGAYIYASKTTTDTNRGNVWIEAKFSPVSVSGSYNFFILDCRCLSNPSGTGNPHNSFRFVGQFNSGTTWELRTLDGSGSEGAILSVGISPTITAGAWYRCILSVQETLTGQYQQVAGYVQRMSDNAWLLPDGTWQAGAMTAVCATTTIQTYQSGWDAGTTAVFGCYLASGQIIDMDDCIFQSLDRDSATPASPPAAGNEVEMIASATAGSDSGVASHDISKINASNFTDYYQASALGGAYARLDAGSGVALTPTAFLWTPAVGASGYASYLGLEEFSAGLVIEGANSTSGPWTSLGAVAGNSYPEPRITTLQRLDPNTPGGTYRYFRLRAPVNQLALNQFKMVTQWASGMSWRPCRPIISPASGRYVTGQTVTITSTTGTVNGTGTSIYYTTDGSTPTTGSTLYTGAITIPSNSPSETTIKAIAYNSGATTTSSEVTTGVFVVGSTAVFVPDTGSTAYGTSNKWSQDWYDDRGVLIQNYAGEVFYDIDTSLYYWIGISYNVGVVASPPSISGWFYYSSSDLLNWTYRGQFILPAPALWTQGISWYQARLHVLRNPNPIDSNKKYVAWMHLGGGNDGYACVATAPAITGSWTWQSKLQPNSTLVGDSNVFYDVVDDGTSSSRNKAWFVFAAANNTVLQVCQLDPATDWTSFTGSNTQVYGSAMEAPVLFNYNGYYYLLFSSLTGYGSGNSAESYVSATTIAGLNSATAASIYSSTPSSGTVAYNAQSSHIFQVRGLSSTGFIYMAEIQDPGESPINMYHARPSWWPVSTTSGGNKVNAFPSAGTFSMPFPTSWDMTYLPAVAPGLAPPPYLQRRWRTWPVRR